MPNIDAAVAMKLADVLGHNRVYPDFRWLSTDQAGNPQLLAELPVVMYRQSGGSGAKCLSGERGTLRDDFYLLEVFSDDRDQCSEVRDKLFAAFSGPLDNEYPGRWQSWGGPKSPCKVHWAEVDDPEAGAEFVDTDVHASFRFVRMILTVQWQQEI